LVAAFDKVEKILKVILDLIPSPSSEYSNFVREILLEVSKAKHSWVLLTNLLPQVNFPANDLNFH